MEKTLRCFNCPTCHKKTYYYLDKDKLDITSHHCSNCFKIVCRGKGHR